MDSNEGSPGSKNMSPATRVRRKRQERLTEINQKLKHQKSLSPTQSSIIQNIKQLDQEYQKAKEPLLKRQQSGSPTSSMNNMSIYREVEAQSTEKAVKKRFFTQYEEHAMQREYINKSSMHRDISSIMMDESQTNIMTPNMSQLQMAQSQTLNNIGILASEIHNIRQRELYEKTSANSALGRYTSKDHFDKGYESIGSQDDKKYELRSNHLASVSSINDLMDEARRVGQSKINLREFREKMI